MAYGFARQSSPATLTHCWPCPARISPSRLFRVGTLLSGVLYRLAENSAVGIRHSLMFSVRRAEPEAFSEHRVAKARSLIRSRVPCPIRFNRAHRLVPVIRRKAIRETFTSSAVFLRRVRRLPCLPMQTRRSKRAGRPAPSAVNRCPRIPCRRGSSACRTVPRQTATTWTTGTRDGSSRFSSHETLRRPLRRCADIPVLSCFRNTA